MSCVANITLDFVNASLLACNSVVPISATSIDMTGLRMHLRPKHTIPIHNLARPCSDDYIEKSLASDMRDADTIRETFRGSGGEFWVLHDEDGRIVGQVSPHRDEMSRPFADVGCLLAESPT